MAPNSPYFFFRILTSGYPFVILFKKVFWYVFLLQALMFPFLSFHPLDDATTVQRSHCRTACQSRLSDVARSAACPPKDCGSIGPSSIRSPAHLRWRCTLSTLATGRWCLPAIWSSSSRTVSSLVPNTSSKAVVFFIGLFQLFSLLRRSCYSVLPAQAVLSSLAGIKPLAVSLILK